MMVWKAPGKVTKITTHDRIHVFGSGEGRLIKMGIISRVGGLSIKTIIIQKTGGQGLLIPVLATVRNTSCLFCEIIIAHSLGPVGYYVLPAFLITRR